jgi:hypothetical protein
MVASVVSARTASRAFVDVPVALAIVVLGILVLA